MTKKSNLKIEYFLSRLKPQHIATFVGRYGLKAKYINPQRRAEVMSKALIKYWSNHPLDECTICFEIPDFKTVVATPCGHVFCDTCLIPHVRRSETCPNCRKECSYTGILSQISQYRLIKLHPICSEPIHRPEELFINEIPQEEQVQRNNVINQTHLFIATTLTFIVFSINTLTIVMCIIIIFNKCYNLV
jgi:hypothetical protein